MFGSNPFGQSSSSPFGSQPVFGQNTNTNSNPFAPKPFGNTTPFGTQTGSSFFGSTATGVFGNQNSSPLGSTSVFGASTSPAFGSSTPAFGASSTSAFGSSSSPFGGTTAFGQKPAFGAFGSSSSQTSPFGSSFQQSQPAFGSSLFGSSSQSSFGAATAPAFGASSTPAFGVTNTSPFGSSGSAFGVSSSPVFGSGTPTFGAASTPAFGAASTPAFGAASTPTFGASSTPAFGSSSTGLFGASSASAPSFNFGSTPAFGQSTPTFGPSTPPFGQSTPAFGQSTLAFGHSAPAFGHSAPAFGQSTPAFGSSAFGTTTPFGGQGNQFGSQASTSTFGSPGFGQSSFGTQRGGSRVTPYAQTIEADAGTQPPGKLDSISAMPTYKDKSHEELRWEDYQLGDKGGPAPANQSISVTGFGSPSTSVFGQSSANPFSSSTTSNPFAPKSLAFSSSGFGSSVSPAFTSLQSLTPSNPFGSTSSTPSLFSSPSPAFSSTAPSLFSSSSSSTTFGTSNSLFGSSLVQGSTNAFGQSPNFGNSQSSPLFQSSTPSMVPSSSPFGQSMSSFGQNMSTFGQMNAFNTQSSGFGGNLFSSTPSFGQTNTSITTPFQTAQPGQTMSAGGFGNFGQAPAGGFGGGSNMFGQGTFGQSAMIPNSVAVQPAPNNPFGTLPTMPQISFARTGTSPSIQYGISSMPVVDKSVPARVSSLLTARHLSQRRVRLPTRKYHPNVDGPKVPFFRDDEETSATPKADAFFIPRENPRALVIHPLKQLPSISHVKIIVSKHNAAQNDNTEVEVSHPPENGYTTGHKEVANGNGIKEQSQPYKQTQKAANGGMLSENNNNSNRSQTKGDSYVTLTSQRAAITFEHGADIETLMPKLRHSDYYTEPRIQELAAKERSEPGYCQHVKDFLVGRHGYGSIKFRGETDVRRLDLESLIQFNHREVIVYVDETKKPPIGQGLNKAAEVTLLNIKFFDKKTGHQYTTGPMIEKYTEMLKRKALDQGAEFVSYDPIKGEWKFRVSHFSNYKF